MSLGWRDTAYSGASIQRKELADWLPLREPADTELLPEQGTLVARSRDLGRNHGIASSAIQVLIDNVVGTGLRLAAVPDYEALGRDKAWQQKWARRTESLWRAYADSQEFDAARRMNFHQMTTMVLRTTLISGEVFALPLWLKGRSSGFATSYQLLEGDRISNPDYRPNTETLRSGIEISEYGEPLAYYVRKAGKDDYWLTPGFYLFSGTWERIPARTEWGRKRVLHVYDADRVDQSRGKPVLTPVMEQFKMFDHYQRTELQSAIVNALVAAVIETPMEQSAISELMGGDPNAYLARKNEWKTRLAGGAMIPLYPGDKLSPFAPSRPSTQYPAFVSNVERNIAAGLNMPYELMLKDFTETNYSSARAALLEAWRFFMQRRKWLSETWAQQVYRLWLEEAVNAGLIDAPDFYDQYAFWTQSRWIGPGRGWIDPVKEAQAAVVRMNSGISTLELECAEQGYDWQDNTEQRAREFARMKELGILEYLVPVAAQQSVSRGGPNAPRKPSGNDQNAGGVDAAPGPGTGTEESKEGEEYGE
jgi:lambda family phage portal protein